MFPAGQIAFSALVATFSSLVILLIWRSRSPMSLAWDVGVPALVVGLPC